MRNLKAAQKRLATDSIKMNSAFTAKSLASLPSFAKTRLETDIDFGLLCQNDFNGGSEHTVTEDDDKSYVPAST